MLTSVIFNLFSLSLYFSLSLSPYLSLPLQYTNHLQHGHLFSFMYLSHRSSSCRSWVVLDMDVRGAAGQDLSFMYKPAWKLGEVEVHDHLAVTK